MRVQRRRSTPIRSHVRRGRQQAPGKRVAFRADAAFARPAIYEALDARGVQYAIRMPANKNLELEIEDLLFCSPGRPSHKPSVRYKSFRYQAESWATTRRVVAKVEHHVGDLFPRVGFILTTLPLQNRAVVRLYPGSMNAVSISAVWKQPSRAVAMNSGPLSRNADSEERRGGSSAARAHRSLGQTVCSPPHRSPDTHE